MSPPRKQRPDALKELDELIEQITVDAYGEDEQLWAFRQAFEDEAESRRRVCPRRTRVSDQNRL